MVGVKNIIDHRWNIEDVPVVSIACASYNQQNFIKETIDGFLIQKTTFPVEIVIHDDASTDGTKEIIQEYESKYPNIIKGIYQTENQYSKGIDIAKKFVYPELKGKYVATCEGDDYWIDPLKLQKQVSFLDENEDYGLVYTDINTINKDSNLIARNFFKEDPAFFCNSFEEYLINAPFRAPCTWLFRNNLLENRENKYVVADLPLLLDIVAKSKIHKLEDTTANYRVLSNSASHFTNLDAYYSFLKGVYQVQLDYALSYKVSKEVIDVIKVNFAWLSYNFALSKHEMDQIKIANKLLVGFPEITYKFKIVQLLGKVKIGRILVRKRFIKKMGFKK